MEIIEYQAPSEMAQFFELIKLLYPKMSEETYMQMLADMAEQQNYKMVVVFVEGKPVALCGYIIGVMFYCGKYLQMTNLIVLPEYRQMSIASKITAYLQQ